MADPAQVDESIKSNGITPIFADDFLVSFRIKAKNMKGTTSKPEDAIPIGGLIEIAFVDGTKQQALGRYVLDRETTMNLSNGLIETLKKFDEVMGKGGLTKLLRKNQKQGTQPIGNSLLLAIRA